MEPGGGTAVGAVESLLTSSCFRKGAESRRRHRVRGAVTHLGPFGDVLVINDNCLWTNDSWRNKNAGLDHIEQEMLKNHTHWLWIR